MQSRAFIFYSGIIINKFKNAITPKKGRNILNPFFFRARPLNNNLVSHQHGHVLCSTNCRVVCPWLIKRYEARSIVASSRPPLSVLSSASKMLQSFISCYVLHFFIWLPRIKRTDIYRHKADWENGQENVTVKTPTQCHSSSGCGKEPAKRPPFACS